MKRTKVAAALPVCFEVGGDAVQCESGTAGALCQVCRDNHAFSPARQTCSPCVSKSRIATAICMLLVMLLLAAASAVAASRDVDDNDGDDNDSNHHHPDSSLGGGGGCCSSAQRLSSSVAASFRHSSFSSSSSSPSVRARRCWLRVSRRAAAAYDRLLSSWLAAPFKHVDKGTVKILYSSAQIVSTVAFNFNVTYPEPFSSLLSAFRFLQFNFPLACVMNTSHFSYLSRVIALSCIPLMLLVLDGVRSTNH